MLFAHFVPYHIVVGKLSPTPTYLSSFAKRRGVQVTEYFKSKLRGKESQKVDVDKVFDGG
jgi:hypothetical protein